MSDIEAELMDINGVGEATAEKILDVMNGSGVSERLRENVIEAYEHYEAGQESYAGKFLTRAYEEVK